MSSCFCHFPTQFVHSCSYSMVKIAPLEDAFSEIFELEASPVEGQSLPQKDKKWRKKQGEKNLKNPKHLKM